MEWRRLRGREDNATKAEAGAREGRREASLYAEIWGAAMPGKMGEQSSLGPRA